MMGCDIFGGKKSSASQFGQGGAAMELSLMDHHPTKIIILGRWKSEGLFSPHHRGQARVFLSLSFIMDCRLLLR
jgi:hypothetical protein